ncbi:MAG TPA: hypothetical protein VN371_10430 [Chlorobaculum sp.]|nr:hypothetical protein [Chlorobaculum sp.]
MASSSGKGWAYIQVTAVGAGKIAAQGAERPGSGARREMVEGLFPDRVGAPGDCPAEARGGDSSVDVPAHQAQSASFRSDAAEVPAKVALERTFCGFMIESCRMHPVNRKYL